MPRAAFLAVFQQRAISSTQGIIIALASPFLLLMHVLCLARLAVAYTGRLARVTIFSLRKTRTGFYEGHHVQKKVITSADVQFSDQNQVKTKKKRS